jgi:hypothetical protein
MINKKDIKLIKKSLKLNIIKFNYKYKSTNNIENKILADKFEKLYNKIKKEV